MMLDWPSIFPGNTSVTGVESERLEYRLTVVNLKILWLDVLWNIDF